MEKEIQELYDRIHQIVSRQNHSEYLTTMSRQYQAGLWKTYWEQLETIPQTKNKRLAIDFGCKYGLNLPLFKFLGFDKVIGLDCNNEYLKYGPELFDQIDKQITILPTDRGYIPIDSGRADLVYVNEVISHINPTLLYTVYSEFSRLLVSGGTLFIADGNSIESHEVLQRLNHIYDKFENGPDGIEVSSEIIGKSCLTMRKEIIRNLNTSVSPDVCDMLAKNTSGLFGDYLIETLKKYFQFNTLIKRPYRFGACPTNPNDGTVFERGFYPNVVISDLKEHGFQCKTVKYQGLANFLIVARKIS